MVRVLAVHATRGARLGGHVGTSGTNASGTSLGAFVFA
jgi:hypothetical protein